MSEAKNDTTNLTLPASPVEMKKGLDYDDPQQHDRSTPRHVPKNHPKLAYGSVEAKQKTGRDPDVLPPQIRRLHWPELFRLRYGVDLIRAMREAYPVDKDIDTWVEEVIASGVPENHRGKFLVAMHPGTHRLSLFELVTNPELGEPAYYCISMFHTGAVEGYLPVDLHSSDNRWGHLRGVVGDFRRPTRRDFEIIREDGDRRTAQSKSGKTKGADAIAQREADRNRERYNEVNRRLADYAEDLIDYGYLEINRVANNGTKQYSLERVAPHQNPMKWKYTQRNGYEIKERRSSEEWNELVARARAAAEEKPKRTLDIGHALDVAADEQDLEKRRINVEDEIGSQLLQDDYIERRMAERRARIARGELVTK